MTPEDLSTRHPRLFHVTPAGAWASIIARGLLCTSQLLDLFSLHGDARTAIERARRPAAVTIHHALHGSVTINDQLPMTERALARCLDDGLTPADWLSLLNRRVFFWGDEAGLSRLLDARVNRARNLEVIVVDTLPLARAYARHIEISPINSGATMRRPARRGLSTFTPLPGPVLQGVVATAGWPGPDTGDHGPRRCPRHRGLRARGAPGVCAHELSRIPRCANERAPAALRDVRPARIRPSPGRRCCP